MQTLTAPVVDSPKARPQPRRLAHDGGWYIAVVGVAKNQECLAEAAAMAETHYEHQPLVLVTLEPEDENPRDPNAIRVDTRGGTVGYLPRQTSREYRRTIGGRPTTCSGLISETFDDQTETRFLEIWLNAAWPPQFTPA